jgi:outer membrane protein assembly factor BamB
MPQVVWSLELPGLPNTDVPVIVAPAGRVYVVVTRDKVDPSSPYQRLVAVDDGTIRWSLDLGAPSSNPILATDGTLLVWSPDELIRIDSTGKILGTFAFPGDDDLVDPGIASDGTLYVSIDVFSDAGSRVLAFTQSGDTRWTSPVVGPYGQMATSIDDSTIMTYMHPVSPGSVDAGVPPAFDGWVASVRSTDGSIAWRTRIGHPGFIRDGPAVGLDGALYFVVWTDGDKKNELVILNSDGTTRLRVDLHEPPCCAGTTFLTVGLDGSAFIKAGRSFIGVDKNGTQRFKLPAETNLGAGCTFDATGRALLSTGLDVELLDPVSGDTIWSASMVVTTMHGKDTFFPGPATLGDGTLYFVDSGGLLFAMR